MCDRYKELHRSFITEFEDELFRPTLMSVDLKRKSDACSEVLLLEKLGKECAQDSVPRELYAWVFLRLNELHANCSCY